MTKNAQQAVQTSRDYLIGRSRLVKAVIAFSVDLVGFSICVLAAFWLLSLSHYALAHLVVVAFVAGLSVVLGWLQGMYRSVVRYMGLDLLIAGARTAVVAAVAGALVLQVFVFDVTPRKWAVAFALLAFLYVCGSRYLARLFLVERRAKNHRQRVIIYGAGSAGNRLATSLRGSGEFLTVAMLDDDPALHGNKIQGLDVYSPSDIASVCNKFDVKRILLAMPRVKGRGRRKVLENLSAFTE